ncbi:MAG: hypothetical protein ABIV94_01680 [Acidimicrobiales bacterium]
MTAPDTAAPGKTAPTEYPEGYPKLFWVGLVIGWIVIGFGVVGLFANADATMNTNPSGWATLLVKANVVHDFVLLPFVFGVGYVVARVVPARVRAPVQAGLICSGAVTLFAYPFVRGYGRNESNPTILPQNYGRGLLIVLAVVWIVVAGLVALRLWKPRAGSEA